MPASFRLIHDTPRIIRAVGEFPDEAIDSTELGWERATEVFYERTQEFVHVISGRLKSTGTHRVERHGDVIEGIVEYGGIAADGELVDYAIYEHARGGDHAFLDRGWESTSHTFEAAFGGT